MKPKRTDRVSSLLKETIAGIISRDLSDPRLGLTTVTAVRAAPDLRTAVVYVSPLSEGEARDAAIEALMKARGRIQGLLASRVNLRYTPRLTFVLDDTAMRAERINRLISEISSGAPGGDDTENPA